MIELGYITGKLLSERQRCCIHQVRAAGFNDIFELFGFLSQCAAQQFDAGDGGVNDHRIARNAHGCRESIVG